MRNSAILAGTAKRATDGFYRHFFDACPALIGLTILAISELASPTRVAVESDQAFTYVAASMKAPTANPALRSAVELGSRDH